MQDIFESIFLKILNMSMTASYIIAAVLIVRLLLRKAPKKYSYALWAVAAFRLVCPVSFKSVISVFSLPLFSLSVEDTAASAGTAAQIVHIPSDIEFMAQPEIHTGLEAVNAVVNQSLPAATPMASANPIQYWIFFGMLLWCLGMAVLLCLSAVSLWKLHRSLRTATRLSDDVWQSESVRSPFIVGLFRPKIYIPYGLSEKQLGYVLAHERAHIKRGDHVVKTLAFLVLCLHWFNPLVWLAFYLMGRDMELSCDEKVLGRIDDKAEYSETLLSFASPRRFPTPTPLAFGESGVAQRIKNALKWHRPKMWVSIVALIACLGVIAACAANPDDGDSGGVWEMRGAWVPVDCVYQSPVYSYFPFGGDNGYTYDFHPDGIRIYDHESGEWRGGFSAVGGFGAWQDFPYTDEEWAEMFFSSEVYSYSIYSITEAYNEILYLPLIGNTTGEPIAESHAEVDCFLLRMDGELWFVYTNKDTNGDRRVSSIYALQKQDILGMASFVYPDGTSNEPGIEISFSGDFEFIDVYTSGGCVSTYVNGDVVDVADTSTVVPEGGSLFWCPIQNDLERPEAYNLSHSAVIRLTVDYGDSTQRFSIYVSYEDGIYTLRPVGKGVYLDQSSEKSALLSFDAAYAAPKAIATDIPAGSPWPLLSGLGMDSISSIMLDGGIAPGPPPLGILKVQILDALIHVAPEEVYIGRGSPYQFILSLGINDGESSIRLGYCGDFVEVQLRGPAADAYPAEGGVWEIHNDELTELMGGLAFTHIIKQIDELSDQISPYEWTKSVRAGDITGLSSKFGVEESTLASAEFKKALAEALNSAEPTDFYKQNLGVEADLILSIEAGGEIYSLLYADGLAQFGVLPTDTYPGDGLIWTLECGELNALLESVLTVDENATDGPWEWTSTLSIEDIIPGLMAFGNGLDHEKVLADGFAEKLVAALNSVGKTEIGLGRGIPSDSEITIYTEEGNCILRYGGGYVEMSFSDALAQRYNHSGGVWEIRNDGLNALFDELTNTESAGGWDISKVDIFGESEIFSYTDMKTAIDIVLEHMKSSDPMAEVTLLRLGYDEELSLREADADAKQYGADEAIVLVSDFEVGESWGAFNPNTTYENWKWILTRNAGGDWILQTWGYG